MLLTHFLAVVCFKLILTEAKRDKNSQTAAYGCPSKLNADESDNVHGPKNKKKKKKVKRTQMSEINVNILR